MSVGQRSFWVISVVSICYNHMTQKRIRGGRVDWFESVMWVEFNHTEQLEKGYGELNQITYAIEGYDIQRMITLHGTAIIYGFWVYLLYPLLRLTTSIEADPIVPLKNNRVIDPRTPNSHEVKTFLHNFIIYWHSSVFIRCDIYFIISSFNMLDCIRWYKMGLCNAFKLVAY